MEDVREERGFDLLQIPLLATQKTQHSSGMKGPPGCGHERYHPGGAVSLSCVVASM